MDNGLLKRALNLLSNLSEESNCISGLVLLGDCLKRKEDVQKVSNELLRVLHGVMEMSAEARSIPVLVTLLQKLSLYAKAGLSARVHVGSGAPLATVLQLLQSEYASVQVAALDLVVEVCHFEDFWLQLDSTDANVAIRLLASTDVAVRKGALRMLQLMISPNLGTPEARFRRRDLFVANQIRPRLVSLLRTENNEEMRDAAAELLSSVVMGEPSPAVEAFSAAPLTPGVPHLTPQKTPNRAKSTAAIASSPKTPLVPRMQAMPSMETEFDFVDFVALITQPGPVAQRGCQLLQNALATWGNNAEAAKTLRRQRGVEYLVGLLLNLSDPERASAEWSIKTRRIAMQVLSSVLNADSGCLDCFLDCGGLECAVLFLSSFDKQEQEFGASSLEMIAARGVRETSVLEELLGSAKPTAEALRPTPFMMQSTSRARMELEACRGIPNDASRVLQALAQEGFPLFDGARMLHRLCYWNGQCCPSLDALRTELREERDDSNRRELSKVKFQHEQALLKLDLDHQRELRAAEMRVAVEAAEKSAKIRNDAEQSRRKALAEVEVEAAKERAKSLLDNEIQMIEKKWEAEKKWKETMAKEDIQTKMQDLLGRMSQMAQEIAELKQQDLRSKEQIASQTELIAQLSRVSNQLFNDDEGSPVLPQPTSATSGSKKKGLF